MGLPHRQAIAVELLPAGAPYLGGGKSAKSTVINREGTISKVK
jgi:hypothetical protein